MKEQKKEQKVHKIPEMPPLADPKSNRQVKEVIPPVHRPLTATILFGTGKKPNWRNLMHHFRREGRLSKEHVLDIIKQATAIFKSEPNVLSIDDPITVVGDIHGQFYDLAKILEIGGDPEHKKYIFLGDYIDRGSFSVETVLTLYSIKINCPKTIVMLRGNHECRQLATFFNFKQEVLHKHDVEVFHAFMESFDALPLGCVLNERFLAIHAGISPAIKSIDDLKKINRFQEPPKEGAFCDILWSDPIDNDSGVCEPPFTYNSVRGCSYYYGYSLFSNTPCNRKEASNRFLDDNQLLSIIRGHEAQLDGYKMHRWNGNEQFPSVITIFSAPNYCDAYKNKGAVIKFSDNTLNIQQFVCTPHPYLLPNFMDLFTWSIPFLCEKVTEMFYNVMNSKRLSSPVAKKADEPVKQVVNVPKSIFCKLISQLESEILRNKVKSISRMMKLFKTLRKENEDILKLKGLCPDNKLPKGVLLEGSTAIKTAIEQFASAKKMDIRNEKRPDYSP